MYAGLVVQPVLAPGLLAGFRLRDIDVVTVGGRGELAGEQVVPREAVGHVLDVTCVRGAFYVFQENYSHGDLLTKLKGRG